MDWSILGKKLVAAGFPVIGGAVGGPLGAAVGASIAAKLGVEASPDSVAKILTADPNTSIALRRIEADMEAAEMAHQEKMAATANADTADARTQMHSSKMPALVFWTSSLMVAALLGSIMAWGKYLTPETWDFLKLYGSQIVGVWLASCAYFVGSSLGSRNKEKIIQRDIVSK